MDSFSPVFLLPILSVTGSQKGGYSLRGNGSMDFEMLKQVGVNVESAMERFMGNNALYAKMLKKILYEPAFGELVHAVSACDRQAALAASHTMKGICGNLSLDPLFDLFSEQVVLMRADQWDDAYNILPEITETYTKTVETMRAWLDMRAEI